MDETFPIVLPPGLAQSSSNIFIWEQQVFSRSVRSSTTDAETAEDDMTLCDTRDIVYPGIIKVVPAAEAALKIAFYAIVMVTALLGNLFVIVIVWRSKRMQTTTNFYLVNLAIADLAVILWCSWVHLVTELTEGWTLGAFFCKFNSFFQAASLVSSILTLTLIACDRFFGIVFALKARLTDRRPSVFIVSLWIVSFAASAPLLLYRQQFVRPWLNHTEVWCGESWPYVETVDPWTNQTTTEFRSRTIYYVLLSFIIYWIPMVVLSLAYAAIVYKLWAHKTPGEEVMTVTPARVKVKRKVVQMLVVVLMVFLICWLPFQVSILYPIFRTNRHLQLPKWYSNFQYFATFLGYSNSALNPIIYTCFNANFRKGFFDICRPCSRRSNLNIERSYQSCKNTIELRSDLMRPWSDDV